MKPGGIIAWLDPGLTAMTAGSTQSIENHDMYQFGTYFFFGHISWTLMLSGM